MLHPALTDGVLAFVRVEGPPGAQARACRAVGAPRGVPLACPDKASWATPSGVPPWTFAKITEFSLGWDTVLAHRASALQLQDPRPQHFLLRPAWRPPSVGLPDPKRQVALKSRRTTEDFGYYLPVLIGHRRETAARAVKPARFSTANGEITGINDLTDLPCNPGLNNAVTTRRSTQAG